MNRILLWSGILLLPMSLGAQQPTQTVSGTVRDTAGNPLIGAEILLAKRKASSGPSGRFRFDSVAVGTYPITVRLIGYESAHSRIGVVKSEPTEVDYYLVPRPVRIDPLIVEIKRTGLYGTVGDTAYHAIHGAKVDVVGAFGGTVSTDSAGRFAFPKADRGIYMVRVTFPGFTERWFALELKQGEGRQLGVLLSPGGKRHSHEEEQALFDLRHSLLVKPKYYFMHGAELDRFGSRALCDVPRLRVFDQGNYVVLLDGATRLLNWPLCAWNTDEIAMIELSRPKRQVPRTIRPEAANTPIPLDTIVIWLKR